MKQFIIIVYYYHDLPIDDDGVLNANNYRLSVFVCSIFLKLLLLPHLKCDGEPKKKKIIVKMMGYRCVHYLFFFLFCVSCANFFTCIISFVAFFFCFACLFISSFILLIA